MKLKNSITLLLLLFSIHLFANSDTTKQKTSTIVHTPTNSLEESVNFYKKLDYEFISETNPTLMSDGKVVVEINPDRIARAGVKIFKESWTKEVEQLKEFTTVFKIENGHLLNDLNACWIYLIEDSLDHDHQLVDSSSAVPGNFMGLSLESANMSQSLEIWSVLGFSITMGSVDSGFIVIQNEEGFGISMMHPLNCPHLFFNPSMTFFNGENNLEVIEKIRDLNIPITEEITVFNKEGIVDNIIIRDPGGFGFFIFSD